MNSNYNGIVIIFLLIIINACTKVDTNSTSNYEISDPIPYGDNNTSYHVIIKDEENGDFTSVVYNAKRVGSVFKFDKQRREASDELEKFDKRYRNLYINYLDKEISEDSFLKEEQKLFDEYCLIVTLNDLDTNYQDYCKEYSNQSKRIKEDIKYYKELK